MSCLGGGVFGIVCVRPLWHGSCNEGAHTESTMSLVLLALAACNPESPEDKAAADLQLESATVQTEACPELESCDGSDLASGALAVTRSSGDSSVDLTLTVDDVDFAVHSPTGADLSAYEGSDVTVAVRGEWMIPTSLSVRDADGLVYVVESGAGDAFDAIDVAYGEELGQVVDDADYQLTFRAIDVTTDDGVVSVKPGQVVTIHLDGATWRFGAIAAYEVDTIPDGVYSDCGGESPMLSYELVRIAQDQSFPEIKRPAGLDMALYSGCGG